VPGGARCGIDPHVPVPIEIFDVALGDGATLRVRRHGGPARTRVFVSNGNGFAIDGYAPFWAPLTERFEVIAFDVRNHGANPRASSGKDGHTYAQMTLDLERVRVEVENRFGRKTTVGAFHSLSARTAMKHAIELGFRWDALVLFDPPNVPPPGHPTYDIMDAFERRLAEWAMQRPNHFKDPSELAGQYAETRAHANWVAGAHALMARAVLRRAETHDGWELSCPRELEASIYLQAMTMNLWPPYEAYGGPVKMIAADPDAPRAPAPAFANKALAEELGHPYEAIPGTGHMLQIQKPEECRRAMLAFLDEQGIRY
jgi:pimeloyl-ACP methyl ester carboxylesterase